jgi:hypothetical protein
MGRMMNRQYGMDDDEIGYARPNMFLSNDIFERQRGIRGQQEIEYERQSHFNNQLREEVFQVSDYEEDDSVWAPN